MASQFATMGDLVRQLANELQLMRPLLPTYVHLIISAIFPIYTAAHASLVRPPSAAPTVKKQRDASDASDNEDDEEESSPKIETLTPSDAVLFPVMAGCTLAALYFMLKYLKDPAWLNWFLGIYFAGIGFFFMMRFLRDAFAIGRSVLLPRQYSRRGRIWQANDQDGWYTATGVDDPENKRTSPLPGVLSSIPLPAKFGTFMWRLRRLSYAKGRLELSVYKLIQLTLPVDALDPLSLVLTAWLVIYHTFIDKPWYLTNLLGFSFCYGSLQFMTPGTSWTGTLLLAALFFYDIYFVFYTPMMVTVATKLDVPIKLLFPRPDGCVYPIGAAEGSEAMVEYLKCVAKKRTMAMLGLGDIVVPGMMLAFALRFDLYLFYLRRKVEPVTRQPDDNTDQNGEKGTVSHSSARKAKPTYSPATGYWGERFWVSQQLQSQLIRGKTFPKTYFNATIIGYVIGMITTVVVMQIANHAQPALLYLVPGVLISLWGTALVKGDLKLLWQYSEVPADEKASDTSGKNTNKVEDSKSKEEKTSSTSATNHDEKSTETNDKIDQKQSELEDKTVAKAETSSETKAGTEKEKSSSKKPKIAAPNNHLFYIALILPDNIAKPETDAGVGVDGSIDLNAEAVTSTEIQKDSEEQETKA